MQEERSIQRQLRRDYSYLPPYCPNPSCSLHQGSTAKFWQHFGHKRLKRFPYSSHRFRCKHCLRTFSTSFFHLHYRQKIWGLNTAIFRDHRNGLSMRQSAREIGKKESFVRYRLIRMARWAILKHAKLTASLPIQEPIVYDGLENFSFSQFDPNHVNHAVGKDSLFLYDLNLCPLNRKGRMRPRQKEKKRLLDKRFGKYPPQAIRTASRRVFERLLEKTPGLELYTDRHFQYRRALWGLKPKLHVQVSSKVARNFKNPLFAVNNIDMQARHNLAAFRRETIAFSKHSVAMLESFVLYMVYRNYLRPKFWGTHRSDPDCGRRSPAMYVGVCDKILSFREFFSHRVCVTQVKLNIDWELLYYRVDPWSRRIIKHFL